MLGIARGTTLVLLLFLLFALLEAHPEPAGSSAFAVLFSGPKPATRSVGAQNYQGYSMEYQTWDGVLVTVFYSVEERKFTWNRATVSLLGSSRVTFESNGSSWLVDFGNKRWAILESGSRFLDVCQFARLFDAAVSFFVTRVKSIALIDTIPALLADTVAVTP